MPPNSVVIDPSRSVPTMRKPLVTPLAIARRYLAFQTQLFLSISRVCGGNRVWEVSNSFRDLWRFLVKIATEPKLARRRWLHLLRALLQPIVSITYFRLIERTPVLKALVAKSPSWLLKTQRPYLCKALSASMAVYFIEQHYQWFEKLLPRSVADQLAIGSGFTLAHIEARSGTYKLTLSPTETFEREGELLIRLWNEQPLKDTLVGTIAFSIITNKETRPCLMIGCVQGPKPKDGLALMKQATRDFHGRRPLHLLLGATLAMSRVWNADIFGINNRNQILQHWTRINRKVTFNYDRFWSETDGRSDQKNGFRLPAHLPRWEIEEISSHKRSQYRRRYELEDDVDSQITKSLRPNSGTSTRAYG